MGFVNEEQAEVIGQLKGLETHRAVEGEGSERMEPLKEVEWAR